MEKNMYQSYEFLPVSNAEVTASDQYFIVQDDGTFINADNSQVQYMTQVQDVKDVLEGLQPCPVYDVSQQQYFVDVNNGAELIVSDQLMLSSDEQSNVFANGYLLQSVPETRNDISQSVSEQNDIVTPVTPAANEPTEACTEITLNDEQCRILEEKGWILLEMNDKIYMLNTLGLHDITGNGELIQKCRDIISQKETGDELQYINNAPANPQAAADPPPADVIKSESVSNHENINLHSLPKIADIKSEVPLVTKRSRALKNMTPIASKLSKVTPKAKFKSKKLESKKNSTSNIKRVIRVGLKLASSDVPDKIFLGYTASGKELFAKIKDIETNVHKKSILSNQLSRDKDTNVKDNICKGDNTKHSHNLQNGSHNYSNEPSTEVERAMHQAINGYGEMTCTAEDLSTAESIVTQLLEMGSVRDILVGRNLILTKILKKNIVKNNTETIESRPKATVTGRVAQFDDIGGSWHFIYIPHLLSKLLENNENSDYDEFEMSVSGEPLPRRPLVTGGDRSLVHLHVTETSSEDGPIHTTVTITKRLLPLKLKEIRLSRSERLVSAIHACSACAAKFQLESELTDHQMNSCPANTEDEESLLTIDTKAKFNNIPIINNAPDGTKTYGCTYCMMQFKRISNFRRHLITHFSPEYFMENTPTEGSQEPTGKCDISQSKRGTYKCNMCTSTYLHPTTLTKHILSKHINTTT